METTRRRLASTNSALACSAWCSPSWISRTVTRRPSSVIAASSSTFLIFFLALSMTLARSSISSGRRPSFLATARWRRGDERISRKVLRKSRCGSPARCSHSSISRWAASIRDTRPLSRATIRSICFLLRRISCRASNSSCLMPATCVRCFRRADSDGPRALVFSSAFSKSLCRRRTFSMILHTRSTCQASSNSASSSSASLTTSLTRIFCFRSLSPRSRISSMATLELSTTCNTRRSPSSMRLAISTSPSRVSRDTDPILRKYMRTGSLVLE